MAIGRTVWGPRVPIWRGLRSHCPMYSVSCIFFNKCLYFSYCMAGYLLDRPHRYIERTIKGNLHTYFFKKHTILKSEQGWKCGLTGFLLFRVEQRALSWLLVKETASQVFSLLPLTLLPIIISTVSKGDFFPVLNSLILALSQQYRKFGNF